MPKSRTVVIKLGVATSIANAGPFTTFTYTINNPVEFTTISRGSNQLDLTWKSRAAARYTIESTPNLLEQTWTPLPFHTDMQGVEGTMTRSIITGNAVRGFFRVKGE